MSLLLPLLLIVFLLCLIAQKRFEQMVAPFVCGLMLVCYPVAALRCPECLPFVAWAVAAALLALAAFLCARGRRSLKSWPGLLFTPGFLGFAVLATLLFYATEWRDVWWYDDIRYWAMEPKSLYLAGGFVDAAHHLAPDFAMYTPGLPLLQWLGLMIYGEWNECVLFYALCLFNLAFLTPFSKRITWKKAYWLPLFLLFAIGMPTVFNAFNYYTLSVDTALGLCFGYALCELWRLGKAGGATAWHVVTLALSLCAVVMVNQVGVLLLVGALVLALLCLRAKPRVKLSTLAIVFGVPAAVLASWYLYCAATGMGGMHASALSTQLGALLSGRWQAPEGFDKLIPGVWQAVRSDLSGYSFMPYRALAEIPCLYRMLIFCALPLLMLLPRKPKERGALLRLSLWSALAFAMELVGIVLAFMTTFYAEVGEYVGAGRNQLPLLIERYFSPVFFGLALLLLSILMDERRQARRGATAALAACAVVGLALLGNWSSVWHYMIPENFLKSEPGYFADYMASENSWTEELDEPSEAVVLLGVHERQTEPWKWQYALAPVRLVYEPDMSADGFAELLRERGVTHIISLDYENAVYEAALPYTAEGELYDYELCEVLWEDDTPVLE